MKMLFAAPFSAAVLLAVGGAAAQESRTAPLDFEGRLLVSISDADMLASAYVDGQLGPREGQDALSVIPLDAPISALQAYEVRAGNSVAGPPTAVRVTPDGRFAIVAETFTPRPEGGDGMDHSFGDLSMSNMVRVVDLADPTAPKVVQELEVATRPEAVSLNGAGDLVAVSFNPAGDGTERPLALIPFEDGRLGAPEYPVVPEWTAGNRLMMAEWHPSEPVLALADVTAETISFVRVASGNGGATLEKWGNTVGTEKETYTIRFTPDGRHLIANAVYWGPDVQGQWTEAPRGSLFSIRLEAGEGADGSIRHALVSRIMTGVSPEGLAISPNGRYAVTTNLERSYLPYDDPRITWWSSLTLAEIDPETGVLTHVGDYAYDGILPEAAAFDASSQFLAVVTYDHFDDARQGGSVDFWRLANDPLEPRRSKLVKTEYSVPVTRGAHSIVLVE